MWLTSNDHNNLVFDIDAFIIAVVQLGSIDAITYKHHLGVCLAIATGGQCLEILARLQFDRLAICIEDKQRVLFTHLCVNRNFKRLAECPVVTSANKPRLNEYFFDVLGGKFQAFGLGPATLQFIRCKVADVISHAFHNRIRLDVSVRLSGRSHRRCDCGIRRGERLCLLRDGRNANEIKSEKKQDSVIHCSIPGFHGVMRNHSNHGWLILASRAASKSSKLDSARVRNERQTRAPELTASTILTATSSHVKTPSRPGRGGIKDTTDSRQGAFSLRESG